MSSVTPGIALRTARSVRLPADASDQAAFDSVLAELASVFEEGEAVGAERDAPLLLVTDDAGAGTAVEFWRAALAVGVAVASPGAFPWCLANAPCATLARRFGITGPNLTWLASLEAEDAFTAPAWWLAHHFGRADDGTSSEAWLVAVHFGAPGCALAWHWTRVARNGSGEAAVAAALRGRMARDWADAVAAHR